MFHTTKVKAIVTAGQIGIDLTTAGYDSKTIAEFLHRYEEAMTGNKLGTPVK